MNKIGQSASYDEADAFEREVRRIAGLLYPGDESGGATIIDGRERDGVFVTEDAAIAIEATTSREKSKAEKDGRKLKALTDSLAKRYPYKAIKGFFVTQSDPTADQSDAIRRIGPPVVAISFSKFRARLIDDKAYLEARSDHFFGSARDPETDAIEVADKYVALDFLDIKDNRSQYNIEALMEALAKNMRIALIGEYGAGKSMTLREVFIRFRGLHAGRDDSKFCLHLNLNEHQGQTLPSEALIRHGNLIGFPQPHQLIRAWRSGEAHIILDGFDEVFVPGWATGARPLKEIRRRSVELVRKFIEESPRSSGILVAGRHHFFDSTMEMQSSLSLPPDALIASATDFTEEQVADFLRNRQWNASLPEWLPRRPLIIGYLAARKLFGSVQDLSPSDSGEGWDKLLDAICAREARADAGIDEFSVRMIIERLATLARRSSSGLGPLNFEDLITVFRDLRGYLPDEGAYNVLQRLPGLTVHDVQRNTRQFVDDDLVDAARAGDVSRWLREPNQTLRTDVLQGWNNLLGETGLNVLRHQANQSKLSANMMGAALNRAQGVEGADGLTADLVRLLLSMGITPSKAISISSAHFPSLSIAAGCDASNVTLTDCIIESLDLSEISAADHLPYMVNCVVQVVDGVSGIDDLAAEKISGCEFGTFSESAENVSSILRLDVSDRVRVTLTILRRIFAQNGHSRKESALYRGSLTLKQKELIPEILSHLQSQGAIRKIRRHDTTLWEQNRSMYRRVMKILDAPTTSTDPLIMDPRRDSRTSPRR
ncbi:hypothetical protein [Streptosporangium sandarakinum]|uniref:hypothetical protein n=1 Tax=Streptosporangium sandarakinum TaxID=1260955 RepID=UPI0033A3A3AA